jgi:WD40 repeat protein
VWHTSTGACALVGLFEPLYFSQQTLKGHTANISLVKFAPRSAILATASWDKTVLLWRIPTGEVAPFDSLLSLILAFAQVGIPQKLDSKCSLHGGFSIFILRD